MNWSLDDPDTQNICRKLRDDVYNRSLGFYLQLFSNAGDFWHWPTFITGIWVCHRFLQLMNRRDSDAEPGDDHWLVIFRENGLVIPSQSKVRFENGRYSDTMGNFVRSDDQRPLFWSLRSGKDHVSPRQIEAFQYPYMDENGKLWVSQFHLDNIMYCSRLIKNAD